MVSTLTKTIPFTTQTIPAKWPLIDVIVVKIKTIVVAKAIHESSTLKVDAMLNGSFLGNNKSPKIFLFVSN